MRFDSPRALLGAVGADLGTTAWQRIEQRRIDAFADATDDHQWIHVDADRAEGGPFGGTIAHGFLTLSLLAPAMIAMLEVDGTAAVVNAGLDRVRFLTPVRSGSRIRCSGTLAAAESVAAGVRASVHAVVELDGSDRPALVADALVVFVPQ